MKKRTLTTVLFILLLFIAGCDNRSRVEAMDNSKVTELPEPTPKPTPEVTVIRETEDQLFFEVEIPVNEEEISEEELRALEEKNLINFFMGKPKWIKIYPELAAEYGIKLELKPGADEGVIPEGYNLITTDYNLETYFDYLYWNASYLCYEDPLAKQQEWIMQYFVKHPELVDAHSEIAAGYGITEFDEDFWRSYVETLSDAEAWNFFRGNTEMIQLMPDLAEYYLGNE